MSVIRTIFVLVHRLTLLIVRKFLNLLLPYTVPLFPTPSNLLANLVGINPLAIKPKPLPLPLFLTNLPKVIPSMPVIFDPLNFMGKQRRQGQSSDSGFPDPTQFALSDKIRTWGQRNKLASRLTGEKLERSRKAMDDIEKTNPTPKKKEVDETPIEGMNRIVAEGLDNLGRKKQNEHDDPPPDPPSIKDEDYARLSAEKQVYEQSQQTATVSPPPTAPPAAPPQQDPVRPPTPPKSASSGSEVYLGPTSGEISVVPAPKDNVTSAVTTALEGPYNTLRDMHLTGPKTVKSKREDKALQKSLAGITGTGDWFRLPGRGGL